MKAPSLKAIIKPGIFTLTLTLSIFAGIWILHFFQLQESTELQSSDNSNWLMAYRMIAIVVLISLNSVLLRRFVLHFSIIRTKSFLPVLFFLCFTAVWPDLRTNVFPHFFLTISLVSLELFFGMYRERSAVEQAFLGSILIALASLVNPLILIIFPLFWIGFTILKSLSLRSLLASLSGIAVPWIIYATVFILKGYKMEIADEFTLFLQPLAIDVTDNSPALLLYVALLSSITLFSLGGLFSKLLDDSIQTRKYIHMLVMLLFTLISLAVLYTEIEVLILPFIAFLLSVLLAHPFTLRKALLYPVLFIIFVAATVFYLVCQYLQIL